MNVSGPAVLVICGMLIAIILVLVWHPQRSRAKRKTLQKAMQKKMGSAYLNLLFVR